MARDSLSRYIWLVDTIRRYGRITRQEIDRNWARSSLSNGAKGFTRRTFYNYRQAIQELFSINIECDPATYEYYISDSDPQNNNTANWLLDSTATSEIITSARDIAKKVFLEDVPSAREHLSIIIQALRGSNTVRFDYHPYTRSLPTKGVVIEPYFIKIFKQRWYVIGRNVGEKKIKTYALDRISNLIQLSDTFAMPADFDAASYFNDAFGIVVDQSEPKKVVVKVEPTQAKYFRALPLHHSQQEYIHDQFSIFHYRMRVTRDLISELLSYGSRITVVEPKELRVMMKSELKKALAQYAD